MTSIAADLPGIIASRLDPALEKLIHFTVGLELRDPIRTGLADHRKGAATRTAEAFVDRARALSLGVLARDQAAIEAFDALVKEAVDRMRAEAPIQKKLFGRLDRALYQPGSELLDDPAFPIDERSEALDKLDRLNRALGSYDGFFDAILPLVEAAEAAGRTPVRIHDLAAGHAGFALYLKERLGLRAAIEASDLKGEYLDIGRRRAALAGLEIDLFVADALALDGLRERGVDVVVCTQSIHHFSPGMVARMLGEAAKVASVGVCLVDGERSWMNYLLIGIATALYGRSWVLFHDGLVSLRRMFYEEELGLLAALAPGLTETSRIETGVLRPAHAFVRATRRAALG